MQIIIDIPKHVIEVAKSSPNYYPTYHFEKIWRAIVNGTPLPKGHGRLIDADALNRKDVNCANVPMNFIDTSPTIIEADKPKREEKNDC